MSTPVKIPADIDVEDKILGPLTARQLGLFAATGLVLYVAWRAVQQWVPWPVFTALALLVAASVAVLVLGHRDGLSLDRLLLAAVRQYLQPRVRVATAMDTGPIPDSIAQAAASGKSDGEAAVGIGLPAEEVSATGVIDLGRDGLAVVATCSTVNFALRTSGEQDALVAVFARWLHSLNAPAQLLVRAERLDVSAQIAELDQQAPHLPHPALTAAAREHADYLHELAAGSDLLRRQVLLILREPRAVVPKRPGGFASWWPGRGRERACPQGEAERRAAEARLSRRLQEAADLLHPAGITVTPLDAAQATSVLTSACNPDRLVPGSAELAGADEIITSPRTNEHEEPS